MDSRNPRNSRLQRTKLAVAALFLVAGAAMVTGVAFYNRNHVLATGTFHPVARRGTGWVRIISQGTRQRLQLIDVRTAGETESEVRLMATSDALDSMTAESTASRSVGVLPSGSRSGTFPIEPPVDLRTFRSVMLWSAEDHLNLLTAPLEVSEQSF